ncbi:mitochondrial carrier domain-containing protein [Salix suchowensis]|nr:mitochondrial carrier domain-containing protein [Salix suchowensis]
MARAHRHAAARGRGNAAWFAVKETIAAALIRRRLRKQHKSLSSSSSPSIAAAGATPRPPRPPLTSSQRRHGADILPWESAVSGAIAGACGTVVSYPADTVKSAMQTSEEIRAGRAHLSTGISPSAPAGFLATFKRMYATHGVRGMYAGCGMTAIKAVPISGILFVVYDGLNSLVDNVDRVAASRGYHLEYLHLHIESHSFAQTVCLAHDDEDDDKLQPSLVMAAPICIPLNIKQETSNYGRSFGIVAGIFRFSAPSDPRPPPTPSAPNTDAMPATETAERLDSTRPPETPEGCSESDQQERGTSSHTARLEREQAEATQGEFDWVRSGGILRDARGRRDKVRTEAIRTEIRRRDEEDGSCAPGMHMKSGGEG